MDALLTVLVMVCVALVVPLGTRLLALPCALPAGAWLGAGAAAAVAAPLDPGPLAVALSVALVGLCGWTALTATGRAVGVLRARRGHDRGRPGTALARELAALSAGLSLGVVALALVVDRSGTAPFLGFDPTVWRLTVLHFCIAGFAASLLVGQSLVSVPGRLTATACVLVPLGTALVAAGHFLGDWCELAGAVSLTSGLLLASAVLLRRVVRWSTAEGQLVGVAAAITPATMALALWWAVGEAADLPHPTLTWTAATHGVGNALGIGLAGVLGWTTLAKEQL